MDSSLRINRTEMVNQGVIPTPTTPPGSDMQIISTHTPAQGISKGSSVGDKISDLKARFTPSSFRASDKAGEDQTAEKIEIQPIKTGEEIDGYFIESEIGRGGMAIVYRAHTTSSTNGNGACAFKSLLPGQRNLTEVLRFIREARALERLNHPNIIKVYDVGGDNQRPYIAMELVDGVTLKGLIRELHQNGQSSITLKQILEQVAIPVLNGLQHAHEKGVLHRDIKPENIFIDKDGNPKLGDFGLAKFNGATTITEEGTLLGTTFYTAPERLGPKNKGDLRSDIYSSGVLLYQIVTGRLPFNGESHGEVMGQHLNAKPPPPTSINNSLPAELDTIILKALEKDPRRRYPTAKTLADTLRHFVSRL